MEIEEIVENPSLPMKRKSPEAREIEGSDESLVEKVFVDEAALIQKPEASLPQSEV